MDQHTPRTPAPSDFAGQVIRIEAEALARRHGLNPDRVRRVLVRTATDADGRPLPAASAERDNLANGLRFSPTLDEALAYLPPEEALSAFERIEPAALARRSALIDYLADRATPDYTLDELAGLLDAFARHLERNRDALLRTGYPRTRFGPSAWLDWRLTLLSPSKLPVSAFDRPAHLPPPYDHFRGPLAPHEASLYEEEGLLPRDDEGNLAYSYVWATESGPLSWSKEGPSLVRHDGSFAHLVPIQRCDYAEAALIDGMPRDLARRLEEGRARLLRVKLDALNACVRCLRSRDADPLWPAVLRTLTDAILWEEARRYIAVDDLYVRARTGERAAPSYWLRAPDEAPGTLSALLGVVGHVEKELRLGTFDRTKAGVGRALSWADLGGMESYFQAIGRPWQAAIDTALDGFWALEQRERPFWGEFRLRVNAALENDFCEEVVVRTRVKRRHAATFEPHLRTFAEWQRAHLEATGTLPLLQLSQPAASQAAPQNVFRREGKAWTIAYDGRAIPLNDRKGLHYIAHLLRRPGETIHVLDLDRAVRHGTAAPSGVAHDVDERRLAEQGLRLADAGDAGFRLDPESKVRFGRRLRELQEDRAEAEERGDGEALARIDWEVAEIERELSAGFGLGGRPRRDRAASERARTNVTNQIRQVREQIAEGHPSLARHLRHITTGTYCCYDPGADRVPWEF